MTNTPSKTLVERLNQDADRPLLILCDHAGALVPEGIDLGVGPDVMKEHVAFDIGAAHAARRAAHLLGAPALLNHCSRLVIDPNRRPFSPTSIPESSDDIPIPGNRGLDHAAKAARVRRFFLPYHRAVARWIARKRRAGVVPIIFSIHSFTPQLRGGAVRPWPIGVLSQADDRIAAPLMRNLAAMKVGPIGDNQPYSGWFDFGFTISFHCLARRLPHVMIELRQDEVASKDRAERWADITVEALRGPFGDPQNAALFAGDDGEAPRTWPQLRAHCP